MIMMEMEWLENKKLDQKKQTSFFDLVCFFYDTDRRLGELDYRAPPPPPPPAPAPPPTEVDPPIPDAADEALE